MNLYLLHHAGQPVAAIKAKPGGTVQAVLDLAVKALRSGKLEHDPSFTTDQLLEILPRCVVRLALPQGV